MSTETDLLPPLETPAASPRATVSSTNVTPPKPALEPRWHSSASRNRNRRVRRLGIGATLLVGAVCAFLWVACWFQPPHPVHISLVGAGYHENLALPQNALGWNSLQDIARLIGSDNAPRYWRRRLWKGNPQVHTLQRGFNWDDVIQPQTSPTYLLYISAQGASDSDGAYLLVNDSSIENIPENRLRLQPLIEKLGDLPAEQHKVLVLDASHMFYHGPLGIVQNDFVEQLRDLNTQILEIPNLVVISAADVDQRSWPLPSFGRTVFSHQMIEGVRGAAHDRNDDGRISLDELYDFVTFQVSDWVHRHENNTQTPLLLPLGEEGLSRAANITLSWQNPNYEPSTPSLMAPATVPSELVTVWKDARALAIRESPPYLQQPQTWRRYIATMHRYEELLLNGDTEHAARLFEQMQRLAHQCAHDPTTMLASLDAVRSSDDHELQKQAEQFFNDLTTAPADQLGDLWRKQTSAPGVNLPALRAILFRRLMEQAAADPITQLAPVCQIATAIRDPLQPLPADLHFAFMLHHDLPPESRGIDNLILLSTSLQVRKLAEVATTGETTGFTSLSPQVRPWVAATIRKADDERQQGEDLIFTGRPQRALALQHLQNAKQLYQQAFENDRQVINACRVRDRALATLPEICNVVASAASEDERHPYLTDEDCATLNRLWAQTHALSRELSDPEPELVTRSAQKPGDLDDVVLSLSQRSAIVEQGLDAIHKKIETLWQKLAAQDYVSNGLGLVEYPASPWIDCQLRREGIQQRLIVLQRRREDMIQLLSPGPANRYPHQITYSSLSPASELRRVQAQAKRRGEIAMSVLGQGVFGELATTSDETWSQAVYRLEVFPVEASWRKSIQALGGQIALRWQRLPQEIDAILNSANAELQQLPSGRCVHADAWSRLQPCAPFDFNGDPASSHVQSLRLGEFLLWQADRMWRDHWYEANPQLAPYYLTAGSLLIADAQRIAPKLEGIAETRDRFAIKDSWTLQSLGSGALTREQPLRLMFALTPGKNGFQPQGFAALQWQVAEPLQPMPSNEEMPALASWPETPQAVNLPANVRIVEEQNPSSAETRSLKSDVALSVYYRGRHVGRTVPVDVYLQPETLVRITPPLTQASIVTVAAADLQHEFGEGHGSIAIVLDCSGSMGSKPGEPFSATTRYAKASAALGQVLRDLPPGTKLSVWIFGQATGPQKTVVDAEKTVRCLRPLAPWKATDAAALLKQVTYPTVEPWNESSVVHAILAAKNELAGVGGFKSVIAITDGIDNRIAHDHEMNPQGRDVATLLTENFQNSGTVLSIVGFQIASHEDEAARQQFSIIESFTPPGRFYRVDESAELIAALEAALDQRLRYWVQDYDRRLIPGVPTSGLPILSNAAAYSGAQVSMQPGDYLLRLQANGPTDKGIITESGDLLVANVTVNNHNLTLQRLPIL
ncbi:MAG TPA: hypothetical protein VL096_07080, partial [Pirellulaceae bacterium]|nr:hypothetical protein [Pirellulaceae bacterium]